MMKPGQREIMRMEGVLRENCLTNVRDLMVRKVSPYQMSEKKKQRQTVYLILATVY